MFPEPSAVWVERSRHDLSRPSRYSYSRVAALRIPPLPSSHALVPRVRRQPTIRVKPARPIVGTSKSHEQPLRGCDHLRSDDSHGGDISHIRGSAARIHRESCCLRCRGASTPPRAATGPPRIPEDARHTMNVSARTPDASLDSTGRSNDSRRPSYEPATLVLPPAGRRRVNRSRRAPARSVARSSRCRHRDCRQCADTADGAIPERGLGTRRSLPSILSVGHGRQPTGFPAVLPALQQRPATSAPSVQERSPSEVDLPLLSRRCH